MFFWCHFQLVEDMVPQGLHVVPVLDNTVLDRVVELEDALVFFLQTLVSLKRRILTALSPMKISWSFCVIITFWWIGRPTL
jgi:hypothetical protein